MNCVHGAGKLLGEIMNNNKTVYEPLLGNSDNKPDAFNTIVRASSSCDYNQNSRTSSEQYNAMENIEDSSVMLDAKISSMKTAPPAMSKTLILLNFGVNIIMFGITGFIVFKCFDQSIVLFSWHPSLMCIGYLLLMSQGMMSASNINYCTYDITYKHRILFHWLVQAMAGILITIASISIFVNKELNEKPHFQTIHSIFGLATNTLMLLAICGGVLTRFSFLVRKIMRQVYVKMAHGLLGVITYVLAMTTFCLGIYSGWFARDNSSSIQLAIVVSITFSTTYVITKPVIKFSSRFSNAIRSL